MFAGREIHPASYTATDNEGGFGVVSGSESADDVAAGGDEVSKSQGKTRGLKIKDGLEHGRPDPGLGRIMRTEVSGHRQQEAEIEEEGDASSSRLLANTMGPASIFSPKAKGKFSLDRVHEQGRQS